MYTTDQALSASPYLLDTPSVRKYTPSEVLEQFWTGELPIRPVLIAQRMGAEVVGDLDGRNGSGMIQLHDDDQVSIHYCPGEALVRQRFTIAHEIGHWALGHLSKARKCWRDNPDSFYSGVASKEERQANQFAAELLMPADAVAWAVQDGRWPSLEKLAALFAVSTAAMGYRLKNLGLI